MSSISAQVDPAPAPEGQPQSAPSPDGAPRGRAGALWFGWWVAACMVLLAYNTYNQLQIQRRILVHGETLQAKVAEAAQVSQETNKQLEKVKQLDEATAQLGVKLQRIGQLNGAIRAELEGMEGTVAGIDQSISTMDEQVVRSHAILQQVIAQSQALEQKLQESYAIGDDVSASLGSMVEIQSGVNAELAEMVGKTQALEKFSGGGE